MDIENTDFSQLLRLLNPAQQEAVCAPDGNLLVLAGAGSGKTRVLVHRIAWLVSEQKTSSHGVLAVTFTNKAAGEMRSRLEGMLGSATYGMWVGTFHGLSHKLLRLHWREALLSEHFQVIDSDDQLRIIKRIIKNLNINEDRFEPKKIQSFINRKKDEGIRAITTPVSAGLYDQILQTIYQEYEKTCAENGLLDFPELLLRSYELLNNNVELLQHYQSRFLHVLVDEFQDTNSIQYQWLSLFARQARSVTVVGDDDQSIYGWRGAKIENIHRFKREFPETTTLRLEQNYRSTGTILAAANALIQNNNSRLGKTLWTDGEIGEPISLYTAFNEEDEALFIIREIRALVEKGSRLSEVAILYRSNAQSRILEEALVRAGMPYIIYGGLRFFERAEIKDALAYLRLIVNCQDNAAFERVINLPPRGIGEKSLEKIQSIADSQHCSYWEASKIAVAEGTLTGRTGMALKEFIQLLEVMSSVPDQSLSQMIHLAIHQSGLIQFFSQQKNENSQNRLENLEELANAANDFELEHQSEIKESPLSTFLAYTALEGGERASVQGDSVQLMTLHSAKGLEFPCVFIAGLEDGLFPHQFAHESPTALEEERRLCYVGVTRARKKLYLTHAETRRVFGREEGRRPSRFLREIPSDLIQVCHRKMTIRFPAMQTELGVGHGMFFIGQRVAHPKFGEGIVVDQEGSGERARVHVRFDVYGSKWLAVAYAKLEVM